MASQTATYLSESIQLYTTVHQTLQKIEQAMGTIDASQLTQLTSSLNDTMKRAREIDIHLARFSTTVQQDAGAAAMQQDRRQLVDTIRQQLAVLCPKAQGIQALQNNQITKIAVGRKTASKYGHQRPPETGKFINSSK